MTMRRISLLLVGVVVAVMLSMGTALAHSSNNHKVCFKGHTISGFTHKQQQRFLNNHPKADPGKCNNNNNNNNGGDFPNIARITTAPFR